MPFGQWVRKQRRDLNKTQQECADILGITIQAWSQMERRTVRPEYDTVEAVAKALDMDVKIVAEAAGYTVLATEPPDPVLRGEWVDIIRGLSVRQQRLVVNASRAFAISLISTPD
jgi:transcriptional regulator with XRE-family HTH domain